MSSAQIDIFRSAVAGWHDGRRSVVLYEVANDPVIASHEHIHEQLFSETVDGIFLSLLMYMSLSPQPGSVPMPDSLKTIQHEIFNSSKRSHEVAATYMGVKQHYFNMPQELWQRLTQEYKDYYETFDELLKGIPTSYAQYAIAKSIVRYVLDSRLLLRFLGNPDDILLPLQLDEQGDHRLEVTVAGIDAENLYASAILAVNEKWKELGEPSWSIDDEDEWRKYPPRNRSVEAAIMEATASWLTDNIGLSTVTLSEKTDALQRLSDYASKYKIQVYFDESVLPEILKEIVSIEKYVPAVRQADSKIATGQKEGNPSFDDVVHEEDGFWKNTQQISISHSSSAAWWNVVIQKHNGQTSMLYYSIPDGWDLISALIRRNGEHDPIPDINCVIFAINNWTDIEETMKIFVPLLTGKPSDDPVLEKVCWYWTANWMRALVGAAISSDFLFSRIVDKAYHEAMEKFNQGGILLVRSHMVIHVLTSPRRLPGPIIRALSVEADNTINPILMTLVEKRHLNWQSDDTALKSELITQALSDAYKLWEFI